MYRGKLLSYLLVVGVFATSYFNCSAQLKGDSYQHAQSNKTASLVYAFSDVVGFASRRGQETEGMMVDVMKAFEKHLLKTEGISISSKFVGGGGQEFLDYIDSVKKGQGGVFGINNITINRERGNYLKFSPPYLNNISVLITNKNVPTVSDHSNFKERLSGMTAYSIPSTTFENRVLDLNEEYSLNLEIVYLEEVEDIVSKVEKNDNSFAVIDLNFYIEYLKEQRSIKRHPAGDYVDGSLGVAMPLNSDWDRPLSEFFNSGFLESAEYRQIVSGHLGKSALRMIR